MAERKKKKSDQPANIQATGLTEKDKQYEGMFLFPPGEADAAVTAARGMIEKHQGTVLLVKKWDERKLAYEIKRQKRGLYVIVYFTAPGTALKAIERDVSLSEEVLRVMITDASHINQQEMEAVEPQPIAPPREDRAPWDRPGFNNDGGRERRSRRDEAPAEASKE